ncbi:hypothetical protein DQ04_00491050 [Trypanosoma grayi]|uniref:hypothetical protein n=1 Tax=Trypanosoma grayi TaxID=71804 RepID=UPI0004F4B612|nr:hypothetical protein DQ04_00491050 [Trypanosoma grayi]KEG14385.1 hypothetical protein DQ04_00491050 [Trypanosoma grayi]
MDRSEAAPASATGTDQEEKEAAQEQTQEIDLEAEPQEESYDPNQYQNYYYEPADGNYYYYPANEATTNEELQDAAEVPLTPENLIRSYEFEDWEPQSYNWLADIVLEVFFSLGFRLYFTFMLYCTAAMLFALSLNWTFQVLFRMYVPPSIDEYKHLMTLSFLVTFFLLSFTLVTVFCTLGDMLKGLWNAKREDTVFWGMSHSSRKKPPYMIYFVIITATTIFPFLWGIIDASVNKQSLVFFAQTYAFIVIIVTAFMVAICYVWFYWLALRQKRIAFKHRMKRDEFILWEKALSYRSSRSTKKHWYHASTVLEEYGLDGKTLRWNAVVFTVGCVPLFGLYSAQTLTTYIGDPPVTWGAISSIALTSVFVVSWTAQFRTKAHWSVYVSMFFIALFLLLGMIGGAVSASKEAVIMNIALFIISHGMLTRKRRHALTRREQCALFQIALDPEIQHDLQRRKVDTYLLCCRNAILSGLKCFDVKTFFGYRHPEIVRAERKYAIDNVTIMTDQASLMYWWLIVMFAVAFVIALGNAMVYNFTGGIASRCAPMAPQNSMLPICEVRYNTNGSAPLKMYDLALLSALSYTVAEEGDKDFVTWFSHLPSFFRRYPIHLPPSLNYATDGVAISFSDYVDSVSDYHFVTLNTNNRGLSLMRNMDEWGTSIAVQLAGAISPLINVWPERYRESFIYGADFLRRWFPHPNVLKDVSVYIDGLITAGKKDRILLIGDGFNGGYVKILSSTYGLPFVAFNPPGTKYKIPFQLKGVQVSFARGLLSYIDSLEDTLETLYLQCDARYSSNRCSRIETTIETINASCGDPYGRGFM